MAAAEQWHVPPWTVGGSGPLRWYIRWQEVQIAQRNARERQERQATRQQQARRR